VSAVVVPPPGALKDTAQLLLKLAERPEDVRTIQAGNAFEVPDALADAYNEALSAPRTTPSTGKRRGGSRPRATDKE
jgi:hypothetical protein